MTRFIWDREQGTWVPRSQRVDLRKTSVAIHSFEAYMAPVCDEGGSHYTVRGQRDQARIMQANDAVDSRDVPKSMRNENVRKARGDEHRA